MKTYLFFFLFLFFYSSIQAQPLINPCAQLTDLHIVIIGSSTAAGTGPSSPDSTWVNRYRAYLQEINPANQVTNLAIGGTTTYHIMPNWFVAPAGRPTTNSNNNVSQAISLGADAIIVNMPSNDAANNFSINEQMSNFISIFNSADSVGIPVWICTTQPRNFSTAQKAIQIAVRDSIFTYFSSYAIDFWNGSADMNNDILAQYDSGDGVHMNNAGHGILVGRVIDKAIPNIIGDTASSSDHIIGQLFLDNSSICGDSNTIIQVVVGNIGSTSLNPISLNITINDNITNSNSNNTQTMSNAMTACSMDTLSWSINTYNRSDLTIQAFLMTTDINKSNDTSTFLQIITTGHPAITALNDTFCLGDSMMLSASSTSAQDAIIWYDAPTAGNVVSIGNNLPLSNVLTSQTFYPEAVRGNLYFDKSLFTSATTTTNWNGIMFDIVALDSITLDSFKAKINTIGNQNVEAFYRIGSHVGYENNAASWTYWGVYPIQVTTAGTFKVLDYSDRVLMPNDTLAVYLHLQNAGGQLSYLNSGSTIFYSNSELQVTSGTGVSHSFGATYNPRNWSGEVFYHHGFNPQGDCSTPRIPVQAIVSQPNLDLGNDSTLYLNQSILLNTNGNFNNHLWSNNSNSPQLLLDSSNTVLGPNLIWLEAINSDGCTVSDSIIITFSLNTNLGEIETVNIKLSPNPTNGLIQVIGNANELLNIRIFDVNGIEVKKMTDSSNQIDISSLPKGMYFFNIRLNGQQFVKKIILR